MRRYFLIGYMGAGKTTLGKIMARHKKLDFIDLDHFIEGRYQKTISQIFEEFGEEGFRRIESSLLKEVADFENVIISTGGGAPCFFENMDFMNKNGYTIYLKSSPIALIKRLGSSKVKRPLLKDKTEVELFDFISTALAEREVFYQKAHKTYDIEDLYTIEDAEKFILNLDI